MTLELITKSHGAIDSGFFSSFMKFVRFDDYAFATSHLCTLVKKTAENPDLYETSILSYNVNQFWKLENSHLNTILKHINSKDFDGDESLSNLVGFDDALSAKEEEALYNNGELIPVQISPDESIISLGIYKVSALHFGRFSMYVSNGGFFGWDKKMPAFAEDAIESMKNSKRDFYKDIKKETLI
ncbi:MAG: hypothetical protein ABIC91_03300 [Nanoarchaeota archaeon]|nr:hypothetical protein [Nanoarchaeota archaeon]MBU1030050.1 hypothetical protein [Nanoarchaeota archaeon]MBU1850138.1 hypothetical protein [Nanoarchaeota archaeon]